MSDADDSGQRKRVGEGKFTLQSIGLICALGVGSFALKEGYSLRIDYEGLKAQVAGDRSENQRRFGEIKEGIDHLNVKLDRMADREARKIKE